MTTLPVGKLPVEILRELLARNRVDDPRVLVQPRVGEDAAVIAFGDRCLVAKTDPITFAADRIGWYAVNINANDVACMGAEPKWFLATLLLPERRTTAELARSIFNDILSACAELGVSLCGGHTEITYGLDRPIVVGQMLGEARRDELVVNSNAQPGDAVILANGIAIEATAIMAREKAEEVRARFGDEFLRRAQAFLTEPGISVVAAARAAVQAGRVTAMHDPTEGGLATGLAELAEAAGCGIEVNLDRVHVWPECRHLCDAFGLNHLGVIASGALLLTAPAEEADKIVSALEAAGAPATVIGRLIPSGRFALRDGERTSLPGFPADEIAKLY